MRFVPVVLLVFALFSPVASAQTPPLLKIVVPFPPGGAVDVLARLMGEEIAKAGGPAVVFENRPGASAIIGTEAVSRAAPDGGTVGVVAPSFLITAAIRKLPYDPFKSFEHVCRIIDSPQVVAVNAASPYRSFDDLVSAARAKPGALMVGANGPATTQHVVAEMVKKASKADMTFVPFNGAAPSVTALLGDQINVVVANYSEVKSFSDSGALRLLLVTSPQRIASLPDVPTAREKGLDFDITNWFGIVATGKTPKAGLDAITGYIKKAMANARMVEKLGQIQLIPSVLCGDAFVAFLKDQNDLYAAIVREAGIKDE
jgi:tripartite-type tricarboxylate transporter receptor subunit TctC